VKLLYITNARIPTEKAHGLQIIKMCEAFQRRGIQVTLVVPFRKQSQAMRQVRNVWEHYDVETPFQIKHIIAPDFVAFAKKIPVGIMTGLYYLQCLLFSSLAVILHLFTENCIYYSRDLQTIFLLCLTKWIHRKSVYFEAHELHGGGDKRGFAAFMDHKIMLWMMRRVDGVIVITRQLKACYVALGVDEHKIMVVPDGIDKKRLFGSLNQVEARQRLKISLDRKIICYTGHLFQWKGVYTLAESAKYLPENYAIYIVGGMEPDILALQSSVAEQQLNNITITGYVAYPEVPVYLGAADVLVLPNSSKARISREYTSPLKLFEYMGARRPIVASDLPSIKEVLHHRENAYLVPPDDPKSLADGILQVMQNRGLSEHITKTAYAEIQDYTWDKRAGKIIEFLKEN